MRWAVGLVLFFAVMFAANAIFVWVALSVSAQDEIVESYTEREQ